MSTGAYTYKFIKSTEGLLFSLFTTSTEGLPISTEGLPTFYLHHLLRAYLYFICHIYLGLTYTCIFLPYLLRAYLFLFAISTEGLPIFLFLYLPGAYPYFICHIY